MSAALFRDREQRLISFHQRKDRRKQESLFFLILSSFSLRFMWLGRIVYPLFICWKFGYCLMDVDNSPNHIIFGVLVFLSCVILLVYCALFVVFISYSSRSQHISQFQPSCSSSFAFQDSLFALHRSAAVPG